MTQTSFYSSNYQCWPPVSNTEMNNANSPHWHEQAMAYGKRLCDRIGYEDYCNFIDDLEDDSWYAIYRACEAELARLLLKDRDQEMREARLEASKRYNKEHDYWRGQPIQLYIQKYYPD